MSKEALSDAWVERLWGRLETSLAHLRRVAFATSLLLFVLWQAKIWMHLQGIQPDLNSSMSSISSEVSRLKRMM
ncbi:hypothetical protein M5689_002208 [Euphorbia peplus]|nr:hypothetical protein M5689_002208 [Euphorbia peplus]